MPCGQFEISGMGSYMDKDVSTTSVTFPPAPSCTDLGKASFTGMYAIAPEQGRVSDAK